MATNNQPLYLISYERLVDLIKTEIEAKQTPTLINLTTQVEAKMVKTSKVDGSINPFWAEGITKESTKTLLPVFNYTARVEKNMSKEGVEGNHELGVLSGKKHIGKCLLSNLDETKHYIMVEQFESKPSASIYRHNGVEIPKSAVEKWITKPSNAYGSQGQERKVQVITPTLSNIKRITISGTRYEILPRETAPTISSKVAQK